MRPVIEYGCQVWVDASKTQLNRLNRIQTRAPARALSVHRCTSRIAMDAELSLAPLHVRRETLLLRYIARIEQRPRHILQHRFRHLLAHPMHKLGVRRVPAFTRYQRLLA